MFERNRVDNTSNTAHQTAVPAEVTLSDGQVQTGHLIINSARAVVDVLNGETLFIEFEPFGSARRFISKHAVLAVRIIEAGAASSLEQRRPINGEFDPYGALGVARNAEWDDIRQAYLRLAKAYHADRYASIELPAEVREYLQQMSRRVNAAYTLLEAPRLVVRKADLRAAPVYTSRPRA
jgi:DnaJ domain